jgi:hypothetical protein
MMKQKSFYTSQVSSGISGLSAFHDTHVKTDAVDTITLEYFCQQNQIDHIDFLKVDTEGYDYFVLKGLRWDTVRPLAIVCEFEDRKTIPLGYNFKDLADLLTSQKYFLLVSEWYPITEYGRTHKWKAFYTYPHELSNEKAWGNIIAIENKELFDELLGAVRLT